MNGLLDRQSFAGATPHDSLDTGLRAGGRDQLRAGLYGILNDKVEAKRLLELIALPKKDPINMATSGVGSATHMTLERFKAATRANITTCPARAAAR